MGKKENLEKFLEVLNAFASETKEAEDSIENETEKGAMTPEEQAAITAGAAASVAPGGDGVAATEAGSEMRGSVTQAAKAEVRAAAAADETASINDPHGNTAQDQRVMLARKVERMAGGDLQAQAAREQAIDTAAIAPPNQTNMAKGAEEAEDRVTVLLAGIHEMIQKEASSEEEADEAIKQASEAVQYGRYVALGFVDALRELASEEAEA